LLRGDRAQHPARGETTGAEVTSVTYFPQSNDPEDSFPVPSGHTMSNTLSHFLQQRLGTRVRAQIPLRLVSLDPSSAISENCHTVFVNPHGCGVRFRCPLQPGLRLRVESLPGGGSVNARVASNVPPSGDSRYWTVGIGLDSPGNHWCLAPVPADWGDHASIPKFFPASTVSATALRQRNQQPSNQPPRLP
jgi:hypothetical protein